LFGQIDYINLLPFHLFMKKYYPNYTTKKSYPAQINRMFERKRVSGAFISSIKSQHKTCFDLGIVAKKEVLSVLICEGEEKEDIESNTSNILAKILNQKGEVIIGDKALKHYYQNNKKSCQDLALLWYKKYKLPFVFARFCVNGNKKRYRKMVNKFLKTKIYIPTYILKKYEKRGVTSKQIKEYLKYIQYEIGDREKKSLKKFFKLAKKRKKL